MRKQQNAEQNSTFTMTPEIHPNQNWRVARVQALEDFRLHVTFLDGLAGEVDLSDRVHSDFAGVFSVLSDPIFFAKVYVELGAVTWPGEIDIAPDAMYREIKKNGVWKLR